MDEFAIRSASAGDGVAIARVHASAWRAAFTFLPSRFLDAMTPEAVLAMWRENLRGATSSLFVAVDDGRIVGFLQVRAEGGGGEVMSLYVDPSMWGRGVGSTLLTFAEDWLLDHGVGTARLWTARQSQQSRGFYEHRGWVASGSEQTQHLGPAGLELYEIEYRKPLSLGRDRRGLPGA